MSSTRCFLGVLLLLVGSTRGLESTVSSSIQFASTENSTSPKSPSSPDGSVAATEKSTTASYSAVASEEGAARLDKGSPSKNPWRSYERRGAKTSAHRDSYLEALRHSRTSSDSREGIVRGEPIRGSGANRREYVRPEGPVYVASAEYGKPGEHEGKVAAGGPTKSSRADYGSYDSTRHGSFSFEPSEPFVLPDRTAVDFRDDGSPSSYGPPKNSYGPPKNVYGPPAKNYQQNPYGEFSGGSYSPPGQGYGYAATPYGHSESSHVIELPSIDFGWPFALKLNAFTLAKILLKLVIFKMIVKFIAVICLLLFIPKLEIKKKKKGGHNDDDEDEEDEGRANADGFPLSNGRLNALTAFVLSAVEKYESARSSDEPAEVRTTFGRWVSGVLGPWSEEYVRLFEKYAIEEAQRSEETS